MKVAAKVLLVLFVCCAASRAQVAPQPGSEAPGPQVIKMTAKKYVFDPGTITVTRGRPVRIEATALDRDHGFALKEFGVETRLVKGKTSVIEFTPDKTGEFTFHCSVFCGLGHHGMKGTLIVVEPAKP